MPRAEVEQGLRDPNIDMDNNKTCGACKWWERSDNLYWIIKLGDCNWPMPKFPPVAISVEVPVKITDRMKMPDLYSGCPVWEHKETL